MRDEQGRQVFWQMQKIGIKMNNPAQPKKVTERIKDKAFELLLAHPEGLRYMELKNKIKESDVSFNSNTINGSIWNLEAAYPEKVYKPSKGLFRLLAFKDEEIEDPVPAVAPLAVPTIKEEASTRRSQTG
jgi:hypothetical protein